MRNSIDDYLYDELRTNKGIELSAEQIDSIVEDVMKLAENNHEIFTK